MLVRFGVEDLGADWPSCVVCIGTFDGVHLGHQEVIRTGVKKSRQVEKPSAVLTFDRNPLAVLAPERRPPSVGTIGINLDAIANLGVSLAVVLPFDGRLAATSADTFFEEILLKKLKSGIAVIGHDFAFGKGREGTPDWLAKRLDSIVVPPFQLDGVRVSSSAIRNAIAEGRIESANKLLARPWTQEGIVISGQKLGREIGFPTINLAAVGNQVVPADGVYKGVAQTAEGAFRAAIGIGQRPGFGDGTRTIEAFLLDYPGKSLYGTAVRLSYERMLREDRKFDSLEALKAQIAVDVAEVAIAE